MKGKISIILIIVLSMLLLACNLTGLLGARGGSPDEPGQVEEEDVSPSSPGTTFVPEGGAPPAPVLTDEEIYCSYFVSADGDDAAAGSESQPWASF